MGGSDSFAIYWGGSNINNHWSRESYILLGIWGQGQNQNYSLVILPRTITHQGDNHSPGGQSFTRNSPGQKVRIQFSLKMSQLMWGEARPPPPTTPLYKFIFGFFVSVLLILGNPNLPTGFQHILQWLFSFFCKPLHW